jgi:hypothetical protein
MVRRFRPGLALAFAAALAFGPAAGTVLAETGAGDDAYVMNEGGTLVVDVPGVLANDNHDEGLACVAGIDPLDVMGHIGDGAHTGWRSDGSFTFTPWEWWNGETSFVYGMSKIDEVGTCTGASADQAFVRITVRPVNDAPTAVLVQDCERGITVREDSGRYVDEGHCTEMHNWGPIDENTQRVEEWVVENDNPGLFAEQPAIDILDITFGRLSFTPAANASGVAQVTVRGRDDGGTARGGDDLSNTLIFPIRIRAIADPTEVPPTEAPATVEPTLEATDGVVPPSTEASGERSSVVPTDAPPTDAPLSENPTGFSTGAPMLITLVLVVGIIAIGAGLLAPRLIRRPGKRS